jgi:hypothetical protein
VREGYHLGSQGDFRVIVVTKKIGEFFLEGQDLGREGGMDGGREGRM